MSIRRPYPLLCLLVATACITFSSPLQAQLLQKKVTIGFGRDSLVYILNKLEQQSGIPILYMRSLMPSRYAGPFITAEKTMAQWLTLLLAGTGLHFTEKSNLIAIGKPSAPEPKDSVPARPLYNVSGRVVDSTGVPVTGASVKIAGRNGGCETDESGYFHLAHQLSGTQLTISYIGYLPATALVTGPQLPDVVLHPEEGAAAEGAFVSTGYGRYRKDRLSGSFAQVGGGLLHNTISPYFVNRLEGITSGVQSIKNIPSGSAANEATLSVRGRTTIYSNAQPLILLDYFPYEGSLDNINPFTIESVTILKDAVAASIWGAFSGNGVIVITTRKGRLRQRPRTTLTSTLSYMPRPQLDYIPALNPQQFIQLEQFLFNNNYYNYTVTPWSWLSAAVSVMADARRGNNADSAQRMQQLLQTDTRSQLSRYFYRPALYQQHAVSLSGGTDISTYYLAAGFDRNLLQLQRNSYDRFTFSTSNTWQLIPEKLEASASTFITQSFTRLNNNGGPFIRPYDALVQPDGNAAIVPFGLRQQYKDTAGNGRLLNWNYRPVDDLSNSNHISRLNEYRALLQVTWHPLKRLRLSASYQYYYAQTRTEQLKSLQLYETRHLINTYTRLLGDREAEYPIPLAGMADMGSRTSLSHNGRALGKYSIPLKHLQELSIMAGYDVRILHMVNHTSRIYGYDGITAIGQPVNYGILYPLYYTRLTQKIPSRDSQEQTDNNFLSWYTAVSYTWSNILSAMFNYRVDASNLFGVKTNSKGIPLWSLGAGYQLLPQLRIRASMGYSGNVNTTLSPLNTALSSPTPNRFNRAL